MHERILIGEVFFSNLNSRSIAVFLQVFAYINPKPISILKAFIILYAPLPVSKMNNLSLNLRFTFTYSILILRINFFPKYKIIKCITGRVW